MKKLDLHIFAIILIGLISVNILLMLRQQKPIVVESPKKTEQEKVEVKIIEKPSIRSPDYRGPPYRQYKPRNFQVMGTISNGTEILPLYGREIPTRRDRWNYYTATPGQQIYPLSITFDGNECQDQYIGCPEFYGNETVTVTGKQGTYTVTEVYDVRQVPYIPYLE